MKKIIIILSILVLLIIGSAFLVSYSIKNGVACSIYPEGSSFSFRWSCYRALSSNSTDASQCKSFPNDQITNRDNCYFSVAEKTASNAIVCENILDQGVKNSCYSVASLHGSGSAKSTQINDLLDKCNKDQAIINMPVFPGCFIGGLKDLSISKSEAKIIINNELSKSGQDLDSLLKDSKWWSDPWSQY